MRIVVMPKSIALGGWTVPLRVECLHRPALARAAIQVSLVQSSGAVLPELDALRAKAESRPEWRPRYRNSIKTLLHFTDTVGKMVRVLDRLALNGCPCTDLAVARPRGKIRVCFSVAHDGYSSFGANLNFERRPVKADRGDRPCAQLSPLASFYVRVENESVLVDVLHQHYAH